MTAKQMERSLLRLSERFKTAPAADRERITAEYRALHARWMQAKTTLFDLPAA